MMYYFYHKSKKIYTRKSQLIREIKQKNLILIDTRKDFEFKVGTFKGSINPKLNNLFAPVENILGKFETYVYTKPNFDPAPRLFLEFKWLGKNVDYVRSKDIKDGGMVYWNRPMPTNEIYKKNISILVKLYEENIIS